MTMMREAMNEARVRLNNQINEHYGKSGLPMPDFDVDVVLAEDGQTLFIYIEAHDGFIATTSISHFVALFSQPSDVLH